MGGPATVVSDPPSPRLDPSTTLLSRQLAAAEAQHGPLTRRQRAQIEKDPTIPYAVYRWKNRSSFDHESNGPIPMLKPPETRPISQEQLAGEVKGIYAGLVMVEKRCRTLYTPTSLKDEQYQALFYLFRTLIQEHHDFFLASQHPEASSALRNLARKYNMAARMWQNGIHAFLELLRKQLPASQECMDYFIHWSYSMMSLLDETVPQFRSIWVEFKGDIARYRWAIFEGSTSKCWKYIAQEQYTRASNDDPSVGRFYHHLALLLRPQFALQPDEHFDTTVFQLFYFTKSLVVETPCATARESLLTTVIDPIIARTKEEAEEPASVPPNDKNHFLSAVANLILASLELELLRSHGYETSKKDHLQAVYVALAKVGGPACAERAQESRIRPSAELGLLLCQLLLGISSTSKRRSPMIAMWAPDFVTPADRVNLAANLEKARDIHEAIIKMVHIMVPYLLQEADTRDIRVWGFVYVTLVFMRSLKTRPDLREWVGDAFHAEMLAPFLNMLLLEDETRGERALQSFYRSELLNLCSPLNSKESSAIVEEATNIHAVHERGQDAGWMYTITLPEDKLLRGHFFAREADAPYNESSTGADKDIILYRNTPRIDLSGAKAAEGAAMDQEESLTDSETESQALDEDQRGSGSENAPQTDEQSEEGEDDDMQHKDMHNEKEAEEARDTEVKRWEGLLHDPPLFPAGWFKNSKYDFDERQVRQDYVQDAMTCDSRSRQILCLAGQLIDVFFDFRTDKKGRHWISVPGAPASIPRSHMQMPEIIKHDGGAGVVYVHRSFQIAEIEKGRIARDWEDKEIEKTRADVATAVDENVEGNTEEQPMASEEQIFKSEPEFRMAEVKATLLVQGREEDADAATATAPRRSSGNDDPSRASKCSPADPEKRVQLSKSTLATVLKSNNAIKRGCSGSADDVDEDGWTHISDESREEDTQTKVTAGSAITRSIFGRRK